MRTSAHLPPDATAVVLNVTAIHPPGLGNLRVYPNFTDVGLPDTSTLNYIVGRDIPNQVVVAVPPNGWISLHNDTGAQGFLAAAVDVVGYFSPGTAAGP